MLKNTIAKIKEKLQKSPVIGSAKKKELLDLFNQLDTEINELAKTQGEQSESITRFTEASTHEALRAQRNPQLMSLSLEGLKKSVEEFEISHPKLTKTINQIATVLSHLGI